MKKYLLSLLILLAGSNLKAQTITDDFTQDDCFGQSHNLYSELDSNYVVIMEFIMNCSSCIWAGQAIEEMADQLNSEFPGMIRFYQFAYNSTMTCADMLQFRSTNSFTATPFEENGHLMASYGGFGMPTIAVAAGSNHALLFSTVSFLITDTAVISDEVRNFFTTLSTGETPKAENSFTAYPNPAGDLLTLNIPVRNQGNLLIELTDLNGKIVMEVYNGLADKGSFEKQVFTGLIPSGNYLVRSLINGESTIQQITINR